MGLTKPRAAQIFNLDYKQATRVVTVANITLTGGAPAVVDGVTLADDDRVLVTAQSTGTQNGLYIVSTIGTGSNGTWVRTSDGNETGEIEAGMIVMVTEGVIYADTQWKLITDNPIVIGTTTLTFTQNYSANSISSGTSNVAVYSNANVTISSAGTANVLTISSTGTVTTGTASVTGNITGSYIFGNGSQLTGLPATYGNSDVATFMAAFGSNTISTTGSITSGNVTGGNLLTGGIVSATGNVTGNYFLGNGSQLSGVITTVDANTLTGNTLSSNVVTSSLTSVGTLGSLSVTGNVAAGNVSGTNITGTLTTASQPNITSVGTLTSVSVSGNTTSGNILTGGLISATGNVTGNYFIGNGSQLSGIATNSINAGNSNVVVNGTDGNVTIGINGVANTVEVSPGELTVYGVYSNPKTIASNVVIGPNINSMLIGPISVDPAGNIFVPTGSTLNII
jgi:hypothetical protein